MWDCGTCGGRFVLLSVLRGLASHRTVASGWRAAFWGDPAVGCACASCAKPMAEVATGKMAAPFNTLTNMVLSHATEEGAGDSKAMVGAKSGVMRDVPDGGRVLGTPAAPDKQAKRQMIAMQQLPELLRRVAELERRLGIEQKEPVIEQ